MKVYLEYLSLALIALVLFFLSLPDMVQLVLLCIVFGIHCIPKEKRVSRFVSAVLLISFLEFITDLPFDAIVFILTLFAIASKVFTKKLLLLPMLLSLVLTFVAVEFHILTERTYAYEYFDYELTDTSIDMNQNGLSDIQDIITGAKHQAHLHPRYKSAYYEGGYPPAQEGVCTDVVWRSLSEAGYDLKAMIDQDIMLNPESYPYAEDPNIDFRRVRNLIVYFERNVQSLTTQLDDKDAWQPGDIVFFSNTHVGILSDRYNKDGLPLLIHAYHPFQVNFEQNILVKLNKKKGISGHYRWIINTPNP